MIDMLTARRRTLASREGALRVALDRELDRRIAARPGSIDHRRAIWRIERLESLLLRRAAGPVPSGRVGGGGRDATRTGADRGCSAGGCPGEPLSDGDATLGGAIDGILDVCVHHLLERTSAPEV